MIRQVRVILSAQIGRFQSAIRQAGSLFRGFGSIISTGVVLASQALQGLQAAIGLASQAINGIINAARNFKENWLDLAFGWERSQVILTRLLGSEEAASAQLERMNQQAIELGLSMDEMMPGVIQLSQGLKGLYGEVNLDDLNKLLGIMQAFSALRPEVPMDKLARALMNALAGDITSLQMVADIPKEIIKDILGGIGDVDQLTQGIGEKGLGAVTRLAGEAGSTAGATVDQLVELFNAVGITEDLLEDLSDTTASKLDQMAARWEDFKRRVGEALAPIVDEILGELITWIDDHQEDIDQFIENIGDIAIEGWHDLKEIIVNTDWQKVGNDLKAAGDKAKEAWQWLKDLGDTIANLIDKLNNLYDLVSGGAAGPGDIFAPIPSEAERAESGALIPSLINLFKGEEVSEKAPGFLRAIQEAIVGGFEKAPAQKVDVRVEVELSDDLVERNRQEAYDSGYAGGTDATGDIVDAATGTGTSSDGGSAGPAAGGTTGGSTANKR